MMIDGSWWESGLTAWWYYWGRGVIMEYPDLSHCTWLWGFGMIRKSNFMRRWWVSYDDRVSWLSDGFNDHHRASGVRDFTWFQRGWYDYVGWMSVFSIDHVRFWKHDIWGCSLKMGGHHFMSPFTLSPLLIELPVASPLSLTRAP